MHASTSSLPTFWNTSHNLLFFCITTKSGPPNATIQYSNEHINWTFPKFIFFDFHATFGCLNQWFLNFIVCQTFFLLFSCVCLIIFLNLHTAKFTLSGTHTVLWVLTKTQSRNHLFSQDMNHHSLPSSIMLPLCSQTLLPPSALATTDLLFVPIHLSFPECHVNAIWIWHLSLA